MIDLINKSKKLRIPIVQTCTPPDENAHPLPEIVERLPRGVHFIIL